MHKNLLVALISLPLIFAGISIAQSDKDSGPDVILGTLHKVDNAKVGIAYVDPDADFSQYTKILLDPLNVDKVEIVQPSRSSGTNRRNEWVLTDKDKAALRKNYSEVFTRELSETGDYEIVTEPGPDVLRISASILGIAPAAAKDDNRSRGLGRSRVYSSGAGAMAIAFGFSDSASGEILGIVKDSRSGTPMWGVNNSVTNMSDVRFMFGRWARMIRARLDIVHGF
jgi:hypothetical protein